MDRQHDIAVKFFDKPIDQRTDADREKFDKASEKLDQLVHKQSVYERQRSGLNVEISNCITSWITQGSAGGHPVQTIARILLGRNTLLPPAAGD